MNLAASGLGRLREDRVGLNLLAGSIVALIVLILFPDIVLWVPRLMGYRG